MDQQHDHILAEADTVGSSIPLLVFPTEKHFYGTLYFERAFFCALKKM